MAPQSVLKAYQDVQLESFAHGGRGAELVVMLYDGTLESLMQARLHQERKEFFECGRQCARAMTILVGLRDTLDFENGEPVAQHLLQFYNSTISKILSAQTRKDPSLLSEAINLVASVREAWACLASPNNKPSFVPAVTSGSVETSRSAVVALSGAGVAAAV